jgi:Flp pilus assembly protein TadD
MKKIDLAEQDFVKSLELLPNNPEALKNLTVVYRKER